MDFQAIVKGRRSIRRFRHDPVPESEVAELIDLARHAPTSMNGQPWHFILVRSEAKKDRLAGIKNRYCPAEKKGYSADFMRHAAWIVVVCVDRARSHERAVENAVLATAILLLGAHERGWGSVFMTAYSPAEPALADEIRELLGLPEGIDPVTLVPLGLPNETPADKSLVPLERILHVESF